MNSSNAGEVLDRTLRDRFALETFRPGQREVIEHVLAHRDVLCVMPTGGGKSLCYQLPAVLLEGVTLVVSPLIALMKDQVDVLQARGIRATLINSTLDPAEQLARIVEVEAGRYDLVYVAPERFQSGRFVEAMGRSKLALLAVDEAHCISEWGHDFRPDYARIGLARKRLGMPPCIALTATATDLVRRDIADQLDLRDPAQFVTGFDRPNLLYSVVNARKDEEKLAELERILSETRGSAIVYASSRARCEMVADYVNVALKRSAVVYHAGLARDDRTRAQEEFMGGDVEVVAATNAFGMGVDKADIRAVIHFNLPGTLEAYYQEAGRAGRDGDPARCVLLYAPGDRRLQELFIENEYPSRDVITRVYDFLRGLEVDPIELTQAEIRESARIEPTEQAVGAALRILEGAGGVERFRPRENMAIVRLNVEPGAPSLVDRLDPRANVQRVALLGVEGLVNRRLGEPVYFHPDDFAAALGLDRVALGRALKSLAAQLPIDYVPPFRGNAVRVVDRERKPRDLDIDYRSLEERKRQEYEKLERMISYATSPRCRRAFILNYFGDLDATECGRCDNCGADPLAQSQAPNLRSIDTQRGREVVLKALSGVARAKGRFGKTVVAKMLAGSLSEKMKTWRLDELSTFGILRDFKPDDIVRLLDALAASGLIESREVDRFRPVVELADLGREWLRVRGEAPLSLAIDDALFAKIRGPEARTKPLEPSKPDASPAVEDATDLAADPLARRLKTLRTAWARAAGISPAYVLTNETLEAIVRERPDSPGALAKIKGIGPSKLERYGANILAAIREMSSSESDLLPLGEGPAHGVEPNPIERVSTEDWTIRLLDRGFSPLEAAAIRGIDLSTVIDHATHAALRGKTVQIKAFVDSQTLQEWESSPTDGLDPPSNADPALWKLHRACRNHVHE